MSQFTMTDRQRELARHALGLPNAKRTTYRNHFVTGEGSDDFADWMAMVVGGFAGRGRPSPLTGGEDIFWLTTMGAMAALEPGETFEARGRLSEVANG